MTTESQSIELRNQRSSGRPTVAPDIRIQQGIRRAAAMEDRRDKIAAANNRPRVQLNKPLDIGTDAVYSTLPNNAGKLNESQLFDYTLPPVDSGDPTILTVLTYTVPAGRVLYITGYEIAITGVELADVPILPAIIPQDFFTVSISVDGSTNPWNQGVLLAPFDGNVPTQIIAGGGQTVRVVANFANYGEYAPGDVYDSVQGRAWIRGDMLVANDNPVPYTATRPREAR